MVAMRATAKTLHGKALSSMRTAMAAFNSPHDDGHPTVVLHLQHAFEMLLKAALVQGGAKVFNKKSGRSIGFEAAINQSCQLAAREDVLRGLVDSEYASIAELLKPGRRARGDARAKIRTSSRLRRT